MLPLPSTVSGVVTLIFHAGHVGLWSDFFKVEEIREGLPNLKGISKLWVSQLANLRNIVRNQDYDDRRLSHTKVGLCSSSSVSLSPLESCSSLPLSSLESSYTTLSLRGRAERLC